MISYPTTAIMQLPGGKHFVGYANEFCLAGCLMTSDIKLLRRHYVVEITSSSISNGNVCTPHIHYLWGKLAV
jgi:hypothetical protein